MNIAQCLVGEQNLSAASRIVSKISVTPCWLTEISSEYFTNLPKFQCMKRIVYVVQIGYKSKFTRKDP